jgi:HEAT repeat-containing protein 5
VQTMDTRSKVVRAAAAKTLAASLLSVMGESPSKDNLGEGKKQETKKKKTNKAEDPEDGRLSPVLAKSPPFMIQFRDLLRHLSSPYTSRSGNRQIRAGVVLSYAYVLKSVRGQFTNTNYSTILEHLLTDLASNPHIMEDRHRSLEARKHVQFLLCDVIRRKLLNEPAKTMALHALIDVVQKGNTAGKGNQQEAEALSVESTVSALNELAGLLQDLGSAISSEQVT